MGFITIELPFRSFFYILFFTFVKHLKQIQDKDVEILQLSELDLQLNL